jgi:hypothetical protein
LKPHNPASPDPSALARQAASLREALQHADPARLAARTGAGYQASAAGGGEFRLPFWGEAHSISFPGFIVRKEAGGQEASLGTQALLLYHFTTADGTPPAGEWISFAGLPDGRFYNQAYQGYSGGELARAFGPDLASFERAADRLGGLPQPLPGAGRQEGDSGVYEGPAAFAFQALPRLPLLAAAWPGDEDFPPSYQILFDAAASRQLPTDVCAILGGTLARRLIARK